MSQKPACCAGLLRHPLSCFLHCLLFVILTGLIAYRAGSLACRLAGCLALAAAALLHGFLQGLIIQGFYVFHSTFVLLSFLSAAIISYVIGYRKFFIFNI